MPRTPPSHPDRARPDDFGRRRFLQGAAALGAGATLPGSLAGAALASTGDASAAALGPGGPPGGVFPLGVMSGDPRPNAALLWTRVTPPPDAADVEVAWEVSASVHFDAVAASGTVAAAAATDHCVTVEVPALAADRWYYYRFFARGAFSPIGRARTAPEPGTTPDRLRFVVSSCQLWNNGFYTAHRAMLDEGADLHLFLGDYIYEYGGPDPGYGSGLVRYDPVDAPRTLDAFRAKYRLYRSDGDLQANHQNIPFVPMWDDHEIYDNYDRNTEDPGLLAGGYRAWRDYMAVLTPETDPDRIYRSLRWGDLAEFFLTDGRQYRDPEVRGVYNTTVHPGREAVRADRTMLGTPQRDWLETGLAASPAVWKMFANPVMMLPLRLIDLDTPATRRLFPAWPRNAGVYLNGDQWDGFQAERRHILEHIESNGVGNVTILTGDIHTFWAGALRPDMDDTTSPRVATEFVCGSTTSPGFEGTIPDRAGLQSLAQAVRGANPHFQYMNLADHGYGIVEVNPEEIVVEFKKVDHLVFDTVNATTLARMRVRAGTNVIEMLEV